MKRDTGPLQPRREPRQERARSVVEALVEATREALRSDGLDGLTVQAICDRAGVAPGSMYQYFPSKEAICYVLLREHAEAVTLEMTRVLSEGAGAPVPDLVAKAVGAFIALHREDCRMHADLGQLVARQAGPGLEDQVMRGAEQVLTGLLESRRDELGEGVDPDTTAFLLARTLESTVHAAARDRPDLLQKATFEKALVRALLGVAGFRTLPEPEAP